MRLEPCQESLNDGDKDTSDLCTLAGELGSGWKVGEAKRGFFLQSWRAPG